MSAPADPERPGTTSLRIGGGLVAFGLAVQAWVFLAGGWPTFGPLLFAAVGIPPLVLGLLARRSRSPGPVLRREAGIPLVFVAGVLVTGWLSLGVEREETFDMAWSFDVDPKGAPDRSRILLEFVDHPGWVSKIHSRDLGEYLESRGSERVPVVFLVTRDFGSTRGFIEVQVGDRRQWKDLGGGGFSRRGTARSKAAGGIGPSPFR